MLALSSMVDPPKTSQIFNSLIFSSSSSFFPGEGEKIIKEEEAKTLTFCFGLCFLGSC
jgi:hypothetical protein